MKWFIFTVTRSLSVLNSSIRSHQLICHTTALCRGEINLNSQMNIQIRQIKTHIYYKIGMGFAWYFVRNFDIKACQGRFDLFSEQTVVRLILLTHEGDPG